MPSPTLRLLAATSLASVFAFALASGCSSEAHRGGLATNCTLNSDCEAPLLCALGRCHAECHETRDCPSGDRCVVVKDAQVCQQPAEATCGASSSSCGPLVCATDDQCRSSCMSASDCPPNQACAVEKVCAEKAEVNDQGVLRSGADATGGGAGGASGSGGATGSGGASGSGGTSSSGGAVSVVEAGAPDAHVTSSGGSTAVPEAGSHCPAATPDECTGNCTNLKTDPLNCKTCGTVCKFGHASATCVEGVCQRTTCDTGYDDCANGNTDGCESFVNAADANNCGACGKTCLLGQYCTGGSCIDNVLTCASAGVTCSQAACSTGANAISKSGKVVVDLAHGRRLWTRATRGPATEAAAEADCAALILDNVSGWRLPTTFAEMGQTLLFPGGLQGCPTCSPAVDQAAFPDTKATDDYLTSHYNTSKGGYDAVELCDGRNNYPVSPTIASVYRCTHDPVP